MEQINLVKMTPELYHSFFKEYQNDIDLYMDTSFYSEYVYSEDKVEKYIMKQNAPNRLSFGIMVNSVIACHIYLKEITLNSAVLCISMKNDEFKNRGIGTVAEQLMINYAFKELNLAVLYADTTIKNKRSQHVLEKNGFIKIKQDSEMIYYILKRN